MNARTTRKIDTTQAHRAERSVAAVVAQYVHESSGRHAASRHEPPAAAPLSPAARGTDRAVEAEGAWAEGA
jgi:hypothetical protein